MALPVGQRRGRPRVSVAVDCTLARRTGSPIACRTLDLGGGGMRVSSPRPLSVDETLEFSLALDAARIVGHARVLRMHGHNEYALRFEALQADAVEVLRETLES